MGGLIALNRASPAHAEIIGESIETSLLSPGCNLPVEVIVRALVDAGGELTLILAKALDFAWETAMALLFLGATDHRISAGDLDDMRGEYARLNIETSRSVLRLYQSRKNASAVETDQRSLPRLHALGR